MARWRCSVALAALALARPCRAAAPIKTSRISGTYRGFGADLKPPVKLPLYKNAYCFYRIYDEPGARSDRSDSLRDVDFKLFDRVVGGRFSFSTSIPFSDLPLKAGWSQAGARAGAPPIEREFDYDGKILTDHRWEEKVGDIVERTTIALSVSADLRTIRSARLTTRRKAGSGPEETTNDIRCDFAPL